MLILPQIQISTGRIKVKLSVLGESTQIGVAKIMTIYRAKSNF
jgi:hypothetical protein